MLLTLALFVSLLLMSIHFFTRVKGRNTTVKDNRVIIQSFFKLLLLSTLVMQLVVFLVTNGGMSYTNIQHTAIKLSAIQFQQRISYASTTDPARSLSGLEAGDVLIEGAGKNHILKFSSLSIPLLLTDAEGLHQKLVNNPFPVPVMTDLQIVDQGGDTLVAITAKNMGKKDAEYHFRFQGAAGQQSRFEGEIRNQLPVTELLKPQITDSSTAFLNGIFRATAMLEGSRLVYSDSFQGRPAGLYLFPGENLAYESGNVNLIINGRQVAAQPQGIKGNGIVVLQQADQFYLLQDASSRYNRIFCETTSEGQLLRFSNPARFALPTAEVNDTVHCQLTTSFDTILSSPNRLFVQPAKFAVNNPFHITSSVSYVVQEGSKPVLLQMTGAVPGFDLPNMKSPSYLLPAKNADYKWVLTAQDFIRENGFSFILHILLPGLFFWVLTWLLFSIFWVDDSYASGKKKAGLVGKLYPFIKRLQPVSPSSRFNPVWCYILWSVSILLPLRYLLQWRMASFPPLQVQSVQGFESLTHYFKGWSFIAEQGCLAVFFILLFIIIKQQGKGIWAGKASQRRVFGSLLVVLAIAAGIILFGLLLLPLVPNRGLAGLTKRIFTLCIPLCSFFLLIQSWLNTRLALERSPGLPKEKGWRAVLNAMVVKLAGMRNGWQWVAVSTFLLLCWGLALYRNEKSFLFLLMLSLIIWCFLSGFKRHRKLVMFGSLAGLAALVFLLVALPFFSSTKFGFARLNAFDKAKQTLSRLQLLAEERDSLLLKNPAYTLDDTLFTKLIETSKNQHIINNYQAFKAGWLNNGVWGLNVKPHHNYNSDYATQATDLAGLRYINAEYGWLCLVMVVLLLMAPLIARLLLVYDPANDNQARAFFKPGAIIYQRDMFYLLVVAVTAIMVALSSSNLFVFMGLDLPIVGFNSRIALLFPLAAYLLFAASFKFDTERIAQPMGKRSAGSPAAKQVFAVAAFAFTLSLALAAVNGGWIKEVRYKNKTSGDAYSLNHFADAVRQEMEQLAPMLDEVQYSLPANGTSKLTDRMLMNAVLQKLETAGEALTPLAKFAIRHTQRICSNPSLWYNATDEFVQAEKAAGTDSATGAVREYFKFSVNTKPFNLSNPLAENEAGYRPDIVADGKDSTSFILLAKAVNINGSSRYVFPEKNRFPLIYDLVNDLQKDSSMRESHEPVVLSIDLALHDSLHAILAGNPAFAKGSIGPYLPLINFARLPYYKKISHNNGTGIYWDPHLLIFGGPGSGLTANILSTSIKKKFATLQATGQSYQLNGWLTATVSEYTDSICTPVYITAVDDAGGIHALFAYNTGYEFDPNEIREFDEGQEKIKKYNTNELMIESNLRIHPCLQKLKHGPGSSLKPIIYDAMMSGCNLDWERLFVENNYTSFTTGIFLNQYAGLKLKTDRGGWPVNKAGGVFNEYGGPSLIRPADYLAYSSNLYHSALLFLGGYTPAQLLSGTRFDSEAKQSPFPHLFYKNQSLYFNARPWPVFGDTSGLVMSALRKQFHFVSNGQAGDSYYTEHAQVFGSAPAMDAGILNTQMDIFKTYIWTATAGGNPFHISPLQMGIMSAGLFTQDQQLQATYFKRNLPDSIFKPFTVHGSYTDGFAQYKKMMDTLLLKPLSVDIFTPGRTLGVLGTLLAQSIAGSGKPVKIPVNDRVRLLLYAKTGTANVANSRGVNESRSDKLLLGCLAAKEVSGVCNKRPKLLAFFIDHIEGAGKAEDLLRKQIILALAHSRGTQQYFK